VGQVVDDGRLVFPAHRPTDFPAAARANGAPDGATDAPAGERTE
jgi:hypothetical protein